MAEAVYEVMVKDETKKGLDEVNRNFRRTATEAGGLQRGIKGLSGSFGNLQTLAGLAAVTVGVKLVSSFVSANADIARMSDTLGVSTDTLQELQFAAGQTGTSLETISDASRTFSERILEVKQGSADAKEQFDFLGLSAEQLGGLDTEDQLLALADSLSEVENQSEQVAIAQALLGDSGSELLKLFEDGASGIARYAAEAHAAGAVLDEDLVGSAERTDQAVQLVKTTLGAVSNEIISDLLPSIESGANALTNLFTSEDERAATSFRERVNELDQAFADLAGTAPNTETKVAAIFAAFDGAENAAFLVGDVVEQLAAMNLELDTLSLYNQQLLIEDLPNALEELAPLFDDLLDEGIVERFLDFTANDGPLSSLAADALGANEEFSDLLEVLRDYEGLLPVLNLLLERHGEELIDVRELSVEFARQAGETGDEHIARIIAQGHEIREDILATTDLNEQEAERFAAAITALAFRQAEEEARRQAAIEATQEAFERQGLAAEDAADSADRFADSAFLDEEALLALLDQQSASEIFFRNLARDVDNAAAAGYGLAHAFDTARQAAAEAVADLGGELFGLTLTGGINYQRGIPDRPQLRPVVGGGSRGGGGGGRSGTARVEESPEQRRQRLREEQEISLLNQGITGGSLELLLRLFDQDLGLDAAGLRGARLAGGGQTQFEASLAGLLERRAQAASDKRERDRDTAAAERQAERDADKAERDAERLADKAERDLNRQIDQQFANFAKLAGLGVDEGFALSRDEQRELQRLFEAEQGLTERQRDTLRIGGGGRTPYEQARFEAEERIREMAEALKKAMKEDREDAERGHFCPPNADNALDTVLRLESQGRRGTLRRTLIKAEGLC